MKPSIHRSRKEAAPGGYRRLLRWAALPVTDRRWAAPLSALALGFGLFVGVAISPGASGTFAGGVPQIIEIPGFSANTDSGGGEGEREEGEEPGSSGAPSSAEGEGGQEEAFAPLLGGEESAFVPAAEEPSPAADPAPEEKAKEPKPEAEEVSGTVIHVNSAADSYTVVESGGAMSVIHAGKPPEPGVEIAVPIRTLANGTLAEAGKRTRSGTQTEAKLAGIVTYVESAATAPAYTVSSRGASVLVHVHPDPSGATPSLPALGAFVNVTVDLEVPPVAAEPAPPTPELPAEPAPEPPAEPSCVPDPGNLPAADEQGDVLWQRQASGAGTPFTHGDFAGIVTAVCADTAQLLISADDVRESGRDLIFTVPPSIDLGKVELGQSVLAGADIGAEGLLTLTGLASDERLKGADDAKATQGDYQGLSRSSASCRDCASRVPSALQSSPSSSKKPSRARPDRNTAR